MDIIDSIFSLLDFMDSTAGFTVLVLNSNDIIKYTDVQVWKTLNKHGFSGRSLNSQPERQSQTFSLLSESPPLPFWMSFYTLSKTTFDPIHYGAIPM